MGFLSTAFALDVNASIFVLFTRDYFNLFANIFFVPNYTTLFSTRCVAHLYALFFVHQKTQNIPFAILNKQLKMPVIHLQ